MRRDENDVKQILIPAIQKAQEKNLSVEDFLALFRSNEVPDIVEFLDRNSLAQNIIFDKLKSVPTGMFSFNEYTKTLGLPIVEKIAIEALKYSSVQKLFIGSNIDYMGSGALSLAANLERVEFSSGIKKIPIDCFRNDTNLKEVYLPETVEYIGARAFNGCPDVKIITPTRKPGSIFKCNDKDVAFLKEHIVFQDQPVKESLTEAFSKSMPSWLKDALSDKRSTLRDIFLINNIDLSKCKFEDKPVSEIQKRKDPIISDPNYLQVWRLQDPDTGMVRVAILPYMNEYKFLMGPKFDLYLKYVPLKYFLEYATDFCYVDISGTVEDSKALKDRRIQRFKNRLDDSEVKNLDRFDKKSTFKSIDKSGYLIPRIDDLKKKLLREYGAGIIVKKVEHMHDTLIDLRSELSNLYSDLMFDDINIIDRENDRKEQQIIDAMNYFQRAVDYYREGYSLIDKLNSAQSAYEKQFIVDSISNKLNQAEYFIDNINDKVSDYKYTSLI